MAFEGLGEKLQETFRKLKGKGKLTEKEQQELGGLMQIFHTKIRLIQYIYLAINYIKRN